MMSLNPYPVTIFYPESGNYFLHLLHIQVSALQSSDYMEAKSIKYCAD